MDDDLFSFHEREQQRAAEREGLAEGRRRRDVSMDAVDKAHSDALKAQWLDAIQAACQRHNLFTTDAVVKIAEEWGLEEPRENRVFGPWMTAASKKGWCVATGAFAPSDRPQLHATPLRVWLSLHGGMVAHKCTHCDGLGLVTRMEEP